MKNKNTKLTVSSNNACSCQDCSCNCDPVCTCDVACSCGREGCRCSEKKGSARSRKR